MNKVKIVSNFIFKQSFVTSIIWGIILGLYVFSKVFGYVKAYPTYLQRVNLAHTLSSNSAINVLTGPAYNIQTVAGYFIWSSYMIILFGAIIYAILLTAKQLTDNEHLGRFDLVLGGEINLFNLIKAVLIGLFKSFFVFFVVLSLGLIFMGLNSEVNLSIIDMLQISFITLLGVVLFSLLTSLVGQFLVSRKDVLKISIGIFGLFYVIKAIGDISSYKWLLDVDPLGWFEKLSPLNNLDLVWFLPIFILLIILGLMTFYFAKKRELGSPVFQINRVYKSRLLFFKNFYLGLFKFKFPLILIWSFILFSLNLIYGIIGKSALNIINSSGKYHKIITKLVSINSSVIGLYVSVIYFISMLYLVFFVANFVNKSRVDEVGGEDLNYLVGKISRFKLIFSKVIIQIIGLLILSVVIDLGMYLGLRIVKLDQISFKTLLIYGLNAVVPSIFMVGIGTFLIGIIPRYSSWILYGFVGISVLGGLVIDGLKLNHYLADLSIFSHVNLKTLSSFDYKTNIIIYLISLALILIGIIFYKKRDLISS